MCIGVVEICFGNANGQISSFFELSAQDTGENATQTKLVIAEMYLEISSQSFSHL